MSTTILTQKFNHDSAEIDPIFKDNEYQVYASVWESQLDYDESAEPIVDNQLMHRFSKGIYNVQWEDPHQGLTYYYRVRAFMDSSEPDSYIEVFGAVDGHITAGQVVSTLLHKVLPYLPGCNQSVVMQYLYKSLVDFCERTYVWKKKITIQTESDENEYVADFGNSYPVCIISTKDNGAIVDYVKYCEETNIITLPYTPKEIRTIEIEAAVVPTSSSVGFPDFIMEKYGDYIASGAMSMLMSMKTTPWFDGNMAQVHKALYEGGVSNAKSFYIRNGIADVARLYVPIY